MAKKKRYGNFAEEVIQGTYKNVDTFSTNEYIEENIVQPTIKATNSKTGLKTIDTTKYGKLKIGSNYESDFTNSVLEGKYGSEEDEKTYHYTAENKKSKEKKEKEIKDAFEKAKKGQKDEQKLANDNLKTKQKEFDSAIDKYQQELSKAYKEEGVSLDNRSGISRGNDRMTYSNQNAKISYQTKKTDKNKGTLNTNEQAPAIAKAFEKVKKTREEADKKLNELDFAKYQKNVADINAEETTLYDKTIGNVVRGAADLGSILDIESQKYITPEGKEVFLPTKNELKQQKVSEDYNTGVGKFLGDVTYNVSKIGTSLALNTVTGGIGGTATYWTDMYADNYKNAINEGYDKKNAIAYSTLGTAAEYATGKILGSATKGLTGGKTSQLSSAISNTTNKFLKNPTISNFLGNAGSEATEEFVQEYVDNLNRLITLEGSKNVDDYIDVFTDKDIFQDALYSAGVGALSGVASNITDGTGKTIKDNTAVIRDFRNQLEQSKSETKDTTKIEKYDKAISLVDDYLKNPFVNNGQVNTELANTYNQYQQQQLAPSALETGVQQFVQERATQDVNNRAIQNQVNAFNLGKNAPANTNTLGNAETSLQGQKTAQIKPSFVESAKKYNIKTDNDTIKSIDRVMNERGVNANFDDTLFKNSNVNALWRTNEDGTREVVFNPNANTNDLLENVAVHELYHDIVQQKGNNFLQDIVLDMASTKDDYINARNELLNEYSKVYDTNNPNFNNMVNEEAVASILGQKLGNQEFINELTTKKRSIAKVIYDNVVSLLNKLNKLTGYKSEKLYWTDVKNKFENAYRSTSTPSNKSDTKYSISSSTSDNKGRKLSKQQQDYFKDSKVRDDNGNLLVMYHGTKNGEFNTFDRKKAKSSGYYGSGFYFSSSESHSGEYLGNDSNNKLFKVYLNIKNPIDSSKEEKTLSYDQVKKIVKEIAGNEDYGIENYGYNATVETVANELYKKDNDFKVLLDLNVASVGNFTELVELVNKILKTNFDGIITPTETVAFNPNQIKSIDNTNPTSTDDIRYSDKNPTWQEFVEKNFKNEGKGTKLQDLKEKPKKTVALSDTATKMKSGKTTVYSKDIKLTDEDIDNVFKTGNKEKPTETSKKVAKLTNQEQQELNALESVPFDLDETEQKRLDYLKSKQQGNIKHIDLVNKTSYDSIKKEYNKYKNQMETFNTKQLMSAEEVISANKQGRRTKNEWLDVAEHIGSNIKTDDSKALEKYAIQSFLYAKPNSKDNLNRQGQKYVKFTIEEWLDRVYKGAGVGEKYSVQGNGRGMEVTAKTSSEDIINRAKKKDGESKFYGNITERSKFLTEENRSKLAQEEDIKYYDKITNKESLDMAMKKLKEGGQNEIDNWFSRNNKETYDSTDVAEGWIMLKRAQDSGDYDMMVNVAKKMREMGTKSGQAIQMYNLLGRLTPEGMVKYATSELDDAWNIASKNKTKKWVNDNKNSFELTPDETKFIVDQMEKISTMEDGYEKNVEIAKVQKMLQDKLPPEKGQGLKAWMRISMLFNPKTQVRNILGNAVITPVNALADVVASRVDKSIAKKTGVRTSGTTSLKNYAKGFKKGLYESYNDFKQGISTRDIQGNRFEVGQGKSFNEKQTGALAKQRNAVSKAFNRVDSMLGFLLDVGDRPFYETTFVNSINNQKILNNTNEVTQDMLDIATNEALARTWQDNNEYTKFVLNVRRGMNKLNIKGYGLGDVLIPFAKTPANLTKAIVDYSPVGLVKTLTSDYRKLKNNISTGTVTSMQQHEFAQNLGKAVAGTMLYVAGYALAEAGIITGANDEDKDVSDFMKNTLGIQPYSVKIGDKSFTYDWAQPVAAPFAVMADLKNVDKGTGMLEAVNSVTDTAFNILLEQSFLTGIQDVLGSYGSKVEGIENQIFGLPARAVPTFVKQINDLIDPYSRMVYEQNKQIESAKNQVKTKVPGLSKELPVTRDTLGRKVEKYGGDNNIFNVFLNPANTSKGKVSESAKEIYKVYEATKDKDIMPRYPSSTLKLNNKQKSQFLKISGTIIEDNVKELRNSTYYKMLDDEDKAATIKGIVDYAYNKAKSEVTGSEISNLYKTADKKVNSGVSLYDYYAKKTYNSK